MSSSPSMLLNPDIALLLAEHTTNVSSLCALMQTCKGMHALITSHERSIVKAKLQHQHHLASPLGTALSSVGPEREVLPPYTFAVIQEHEMRARRIDTLFRDDDEPLRRAIGAARPFKALPEGEVDRLVLGLKRASHLAQLAFLHKLPALDLAYLAHLAAIGGMAYANVYPENMADPAAWEHLVAIKEVLLRQGSMALWAWFQPAAAPGSGSGGIAAGVVAAVIGSGSGGGGGPGGKKATALTRFLDLATAGVRDEIRVWDMGGGGGGQGGQGDEDDGDGSEDGESEDGSEDGSSVDGSDDGSENQSEHALPPGLHMTLHEAFSLASGRAKQRARIEIDMLVLSDIRGGHEYE
ncbi:hypothetical protein B0T19DRAFT_452822 [Cercophora scortea]|uniref:Uncharacterized protein n=1 Tax=Cercophora scortea TaxID=314031 RepID=A0AAE0J2C9_9PEZI|nr:hypothetical protein B0T19DRAFT_452822 [Cercophora scortea]